MSTRTVQRWLLVGLLVLLGLLVVTGVGLTFRYRASGAAAWNDVPGLDSGGFPIARVMHRFSAQLSWLVAIALMTVTVVRRVGEHRRREPWVVAIAAVPVLLAASVTGYLLPFDQLGLLVVTVGTDFGGVLDAAFDDRVKFLLIGGVEIAQSTYRNWFLVHLGLGVASAAITIVIAARGAPRTSSGRPGTA